MTWMNGEIAKNQQINGKIAKMEMILLAKNNG